MNKDPLTTRMKEFYENRTKTFLPRRTYTIIRLDGKAFHTYTKGLIKPFDEGLISDMNNTAIELCKSIQGAKLAYVQSDEITVVVTDFDNIDTSAWFDGSVQKIVSVSASIATATFNKLRVKRDIKNINKLAFFDSRTFTIPSQMEVINNLIWRQYDCIRNSIQTLSQVYYSHKELEGKSQLEMLDMCYNVHHSWEMLPHDQKQGRLIVRKTDNSIPIKRPIWTIISAPKFNTEECIETLKKIILSY